MVAGHLVSDINGSPRQAGRTQDTTHHATFSEPALLAGAAGRQP